MQCGSESRLYHLTYRDLRYTINTWASIFGSPSVRVISKKALRLFWEQPKHRQDAKRALTGWYKAVLAAEWHQFAELRRTFNSADQLGDCVVFNIGGNKYRLIGRVRYAKEAIPGVVYVLMVMTHAEYDENTWPQECGCFEVPSKPRLRKRS